jgi:predicted DsbA family dithiol-disulfide isomerase
MAENSSSQRVTIDLYADIICPWCYIGKKRLETALADRPNIEFTINWRAFLLNPSMPPAGMDRQAYLASKFGHAASAIYGRIAMAGLDAGISFAFSRIDRTPDTKPLHKLLIGAGKDSWALSEAFYQAYFLDGRDISDSYVQADIFAKMGKTSLYDDISENNKSQSRLEQDLADSHALGIDGVPFMVFNNAFSIAGAHPSDILLKVIDASVRPE